MAWSSFFAQHPDQSLWLVSIQNIAELRKHGQNPVIRDFLNLAA
jgi:hypothetical protein